VHTFYSKGDYNIPPYQRGLGGFSVIKKLL